MESELVSHTDKAGELPKSPAGSQRSAGRTPEQPCGAAHVGETRPPANRRLCLVSCVSGEWATLEPTSQPHSSCQVTVAQPPASFNLMRDCKPGLYSSAAPKFPAHRNCEQYSVLIVALSHYILESFVTADSHAIQTCLSSSACFRECRSLPPHPAVSSGSPHSLLFSLLHPIC